MTAISPMRAVLVGIDAYDHPALRDNRGARNDVIRTWRLCVDHLRIDPAKILVITSPALTAADLLAGIDPSEQDRWRRLAERTPLHGEARLATLERALREHLAEPLASGDDCGLLHVSGHGTLLETERIGQSLALCAQDHDPRGASGLLTYEDFAELFPADEEGGGPAERLTAVFDCCWNPGGRRIGTWPGRVTHRFLVGVAPDQVAREVRLDGRWHGAFTWALTTAMARWRAVVGPDGLHLTASHADLLGATHALLRALGTPQVPTLAGPRVLDLVPVFHRRLEPPPGLRTAHRPDVRDPWRQLWAGYGQHGYQLTWIQGGTSHALGAVWATRDPAPGGEERWMLHGDVAWAFLHASAGSDPGTLTWSPLGQEPVPGPDAVTWELTRVIAPNRVTGEAAGDVLFAHEGAELTAALALSFEADGDDYVLQGLQWWASRVESDDTFDPVVADAPTPYAGRHTPLALNGPVWRWPAQAVGVRIKKPSP